MLLPGGAAVATFRRRSWAAAGAQGRTRGSRVRGWFGSTETKGGKREGAESQKPRVPAIPRRNPIQVLTRPDPAELHEIRGDPAPAGWCGIDASSGAWLSQAPGPATPARLQASPPPWGRRARIPDARAARRCPGQLSLSTPGSRAASSAGLPERPAVAGAQAKGRTNVAPPCCCWGAPAASVPRSGFRLSALGAASLPPTLQAFPWLPSSGASTTSGRLRTGFVPGALFSSLDEVMFSWMVLMLVNVLHCLDIKILGMQHYMRGLKNKIKKEKRTAQSSVPHSCCGLPPAEPRVMSAPRHHCWGRDEQWSLLSAGLLSPHTQEAECRTFNKKSFQNSGRTRKTSWFSMLNIGLFLQLRCMARTNQGLS
ncbi:uncharacterized protein isoform X1 [Macaca fascicularis]|uniref:uncharacterized protein isoform X1 n=1 Tax=Macaca fascicularis TaxID=9541 RepID=UPI0032B058EB